MSNITVEEGVWDCSKCDTTRIRGLTYNCTGCGLPRNAVLNPSETVYFPAEDTRIITDPAELARANAGDVWNCGKCDQANDGNTTVCQSCNEPRGSNDTVGRTITYTDSADHFDIEPNPLDEMIETDLDEATRIVEGRAERPRKMRDLILPRNRMRTIGEETLENEAIVREAKRRVDERIRLSKLTPFERWLYRFRKMIIFVTAVLFAISLIGGTTWLVRYYTATIPGVITVSGLEWERNIEIEQLRTVSRGDWSVPSGGRQTTSYPKVYTYETVHDGWRDEKYTDYETKYRPVQVPYDCSTYVVSSNGTRTTISKTCYKPGTESYRVPVERTRQVEVTHQKPIYRTWYEYEINLWITDRWAAASGKSSEDVHWPEPSGLIQNDQPGDQVGEERIGAGRREEYTILYTDSNDVIHVDKVGSDIWSEVEIGESVPASYYKRNGTLSSVDWDSLLMPVA